VIYRVAVRHLMIVLISAFLLEGLDARADLVSKNLNESVVVVNVYRNKDKLTAIGVVAQADIYNGYVVTKAVLIKNSDALTVTMPATGVELTAQIVKTNTSTDLALLKVNGLNLRPLIFSLETSLPADSTHIIKDSALSDAGDTGSVLLNDCGELLGFNMSLRSSREISPETISESAGTVDANSIANFLSAQNVRVTSASTVCVSAIRQARETAQRSTEVAAQAKLDAIEAQRVAKAMEVKLLATDRKNEQLVQQAGQARITAEAAIKAAAEAQAHAEQTRINLEKQTASIMAETEAMVQLLKRDRDAAEARFNSELEKQRRSAVDREDYLIAVFVVLLTLLILSVLLIQRVGFRPTAIQEAVEPAAKSGKSVVGHTDMHKPALQEYVLDGRDEDGIRYLLRISGDQLSGDQGIVIGRNPNESPYIINHSDVSRQHARLKVMKNRVFIEDLGSTNGTSVNGQNIEDKGLVSVSNGDQIIIGSVVMKLRVMGI
jgi:hypothetical protein